MGKEDENHISQGRLLLSMAKYIKKQTRKLKNNNTEIVLFRFKWYDDTTEISFGDISYIIDNITYKDGLIELTRRALQETASNGVVYAEGTNIKVMLFAKPTRAFNMLSRLVSKYSGLILLWDDIKIQNYDGNPETTRYMCYNDAICKEAIDFIRGNRSGKDELYCEVRAHIDDDIINNILSIAVKTKNGKLKMHKCFSA